MLSMSACSEQSFSTIATDVDEVVEHVPPRQTEWDLVTADTLPELTFGVVWTDATGAPSHGELGAGYFHLRLEPGGVEGAMTAEWQGKFRTEHEALLGEYGEARVSFVDRSGSVLVEVAPPWPLRAGWIDVRQVLPFGRGRMLIVGHEEGTWDLYPRTQDTNGMEALRLSARAAWIADGTTGDSEVVLEWSPDYSSNAYLFSRPDGWTFKVEAVGGLLHERFQTVSGDTDGIWLTLTDPGAEDRAQLLRIPLSGDAAPTVWTRSDLVGALPPEEGELIGTGVDLERHPNGLLLAGVRSLWESDTDLVERYDFVDITDPDEPPSWFAGLREDGAGPPEQQTSLEGGLFATANQLGLFQQERRGRNRRTIDGSVNENAWSNLGYAPDAEPPLDGFRVPIEVFDFDAPTYLHYGNTWVGEPAYYTRADSIRLDHRDRRLLEIQAFRDGLDRREPWIHGAVLIKE